ncbi:MAG: phage Gp37/Gp68 family protein [Rhodoferax sp.]|nr:phage Gp37/Gp68 family protein [Rhodoferax sp.]MDP3651083.1 phage Gp37/Gp68 family protein [Rhodoferax sp.]
MSENTKIEWCNHTFNPWEGCVKVGPGCDHCYAEARNARFGGGVAINWGPGAPRRRTSPANWALPIKWNKRAGIMQSAWAHGVELHSGDEAACIAAGFIKPQRPKVFCASLADVFDNAVDPMWRADLFWLIKQTPNLDWLLLTKRVGNARLMMCDAIATIDPMAEWVMPLPNVWIGATVVNQEESDRDIPKLQSVSAAKRFLSMEPLLGPVDLTGLLDGIDWVIVGGESGPGARPMHPDWARSLRDQCQSAGVPFLFKQWGEWIGADQDECPCGPPFKDWMWADGTAFMAGDGQRAMPLFRKVGKKAAGRTLDGHEWNGAPK